MPYMVDDTDPVRASLDIVIVNWNAGLQLRQCLESIENADGDGFTIQRVVLVDNDSSDSSMDKLDGLSLPMILIRNAENRGFSYACNQGAADSRSDYLLFLNPDTYLFHNSLEDPLTFMEQPENGGVGITGIQLVNERNEVSRSCAHFPSLSGYFARMLALDRLFPGYFQSVIMTEWDHADSRTVDHIMGAFFMVRRTVYEELGGFDERFFVYGEDLDFSLRASKAGWKSYYLADSRAYHRGGGTSEQVLATRLFYSLRSQILFGYKHLSRPQAVALMLGTLMVEPVSRISLALAHHSPREITQTVRGYLMLVRSLPTLMQSKVGW